MTRADRHPDAAGAATALVALAALTFTLIEGPCHWTSVLPVATTAVSLVDPGTAEL